MKHPIPSTAADARRIYLRAYQEHRDEPIAVTMARVVTEALDLLAAQPWPGNIRELRNVLEQAALMTDEDLAEALLAVLDQLNTIRGQLLAYSWPAGGDVRDGRPIVRAAYPKGSGWPRSVPIVVEFSESMNEASIAPTTTTPS